MTPEEYNKRVAEELKDIPVEFHSVLSYYAYEQGHSAGYEEVLGILSGLIYDLRGPIKNYGQNMLAKGIIKGLKAATEIIKK